MLSSLPKKIYTSTVQRIFHIDRRNIYNIENMHIHEQNRKREKTTSREEGFTRFRKTECKRIAIINPRRKLIITQSISPQLCSEKVRSRTTSLLGPNQTIRVTHSNCLTCLLLEGILKLTYLNC